MKGIIGSIFGKKEQAPSPVLNERDTANKASIEKLRHENFQKIRANSSIKKITLMSCGDGNDCKWCQKIQASEFPASSDIENMIKENCKCHPYCKCRIKPIL